MAHLIVGGNGGSSSNWHVSDLGVEVEEKLAMEELDGLYLDCDACRAQLVLIVAVIVVSSS